MSTDAEKILRIKEIIKTESADKSFAVISLALSIEFEDERDWYLFEAIKWLIKFGDWQKAYGAAQMMSEYMYEKSDSLRIIADFLAVNGQPERAFSIFDEAEKVVFTENLYEWQQAELLHKIAKSLNRLNENSKADEVWEKAILTARKGENSDPQISIDSSSVLAEIAVDFAVEGRVEKALNVVEKIKSPGKKERALRLISENSPNVERAI